VYTTCFNSRHSAFCNTVFILIPSYSIRRLVCVEETDYVICAVGNEVLDAFAKLPKAAVNLKVCHPRCVRIIMIKDNSIYIYIYIFSQLT